MPHETAVEKNNIILAVHQVKVLHIDENVLAFTMKFLLLINTLITRYPMVFVPQP